MQLKYLIINKSERSSVGSSTRFGAEGLQVQLLSFRPLMNFILIKKG